MKLKKYILGLLLVAFTCGATAQVVSTHPAFPSVDAPLTITFDAAKGNAGLQGFTGTVYAHTGVITNLSTSTTDWKYVQGTWGTANAPVLTSLGGDKYELVINDIRAFYGVPTAETIEQIAILFRNEAGDQAGRASDGSDILIQLYSGGLFVNFTTPQNNSSYDIGETISLVGESSESAALSISLNGAQVATASDTTISYSLSASTSGNYEAILTATSGPSTASDTVRFVVNPAVNTVSFPSAAQLGINYTSPTSIILGLYAPFKESVYVIGDFNDWEVNTDYFMNRDPDNATWWIEITGLQAGERYAFQYLVDGEVKIADPFSALVLDPNNDKWIDAATYPNPHPYPDGKTTGYATLIEMDQKPYNWEVTDFEAPAENTLVVYELLVRDFVEAHNYATLIDTLDYLEKLGVNALELMPINEFEGNESWGYNPSYHSALDKYYGTPESFKQLVDECHKRGIAVIVDVVYNHGFSQNPLCQLYWDAANFKPTLQSPYANPDARHDFNVGYDLNHESPAIKQYVRQTMQWWLREYKLDGFRFDLSKGFTQKNTLGNVAAWGQYDDSRVRNIKRIYDEVKAENPDAYVILEHFAENSEEKELADYGCMFWGNVNHEAMEAAMGYSSNFGNAHHGTKGWNNPKNIAYAESHDEERMMYKSLQFGNSNGGYSVKDINTALDRNELVWVVFSAIPGPKMMWQFQELGYDFSIDYNGRVGNKPVRWYYNDASNRKDVYHIMGAMNELKTTYPAFAGADFGMDVGGKGKRVHLSHPDQNFVVMGNFDVTELNMVADFQSTGMWYEYFSGDSMNVTDTKMTLNFAPGAYQVWTDKRITTERIIGSVKDLKLGLSVYPNPIQNELYVSLQKGQAQSYELLNANGQIVQAAAIDKQRDFVITTHELTTGIYYLQVTTTAGVVTTKVVK